MFKIIHTSDWHLGQTFHQYTREEEFDFFLQQLYEIVERERPDAVCISGDIFDSMTPSLAAQRQWSAALERLSDIDRAMHIVAIAGNHDSGSKLEVNAKILRENIHVIGRRPEVFTLKGRDGSNAVICAVPYIPGSFYRNYLESIGHLEEEEPMRAFFARIAAEGKRVKPAADSPVILMAHTAVSGADYTGQDKYKFIFNDVEILGDGYDYVALGHIHYPQTILQGDTNVRYCGAPLAMGFDESYPHSVTVATFEGGKTDIEIIQLLEYRQPVTLFADEPLKAKDVKKFIKEYRAEGKQYLRLYYLDDGNFNMEHRRQLEATFADNPAVRLCLILPKRPETGEDESIEKNENEIRPDNIATIDPLDIARRCFAKKMNCEMPDHLLSLLKSVIDEDSEA